MGRPYPGGLAATHPAQQARRVACHHGGVNRRRVSLVTAVWLLTVVLASMAIWWSISTAGTRVGHASSVSFTRGTTPPTTPSDAPATVWSGLGGRVAAHCQDGQLTLRSAVPDDGFAAEVIEQSPTRAVIEFERTEDIAHHHIEVSCGTAGVVFRQS